MPSGCNIKCICGLSNFGLRSSSSPFSADLNRLPLLDAVVRESLRVHDVFPLNTVRVTPSDMIIKGYRIPEGTPVMAPSYPIHTSAEHYVQPDKFWPQRWLESTTDSATDKGLPEANIVKLLWHLQTRAMHHMPQLA